MTGKETEGAYTGEQKYNYNYGKEAFDLRLTLLRMWYRLPVIAFVTAAGALVFGGAYYVKNVLLRTTHFYAATSVYRVEYAAEDVEDMLRSYINEMSWNTYVQSQMFLDLVQTHLGEGEPLTDRELGESLEAFLWSDVRVPAIQVTTKRAEDTERITRAVEKVMEEDFRLQEIASVRVIDPGRVEEVLPDVRVGRAIVFSAILSCFFAVILLLLKESVDESIWLPGSIRRRYGLRTVGTLESRELVQNLQYFFYGENGPDSGISAESGTENRRITGEKQSAERAESKTEKEQAAGGKRIAVCVVQEKMVPETILAKLRERCPEVLDDAWQAVSSPLADPGVSSVLRKADGILLAVKAGIHAGKHLESVLEYLEQQDCRVTAAILWEADEKLIRRYYFGSVRRERAEFPALGKEDV